MKLETAQDACTISVLPACSAECTLLKALLRGYPTSASLSLTRHDALCQPLQMVIVCKVSFGNHVKDATRTRVRFVTAERGPVKTQPCIIVQCLVCLVNPQSLLVPLGIRGSS